MISAFSETHPYYAIILYHIKPESVKSQYHAPDSGGFFIHMIFIFRSQNVHIVDVEI